MARLSDFIAHDLITTTNGMLLGAEQGKILKDYIDVISGGTSFNNPTFTGSINMTSAESLELPLLNLSELDNVSKKGLFKHTNDSGNGTLPRTISDVLIFADYTWMGQPMQLAFGDFGIYKRLFYEEWGEWESTEYLDAKLKGTTSIGKIISPIAPPEFLPNSSVIIDTDGFLSENGSSNTNLKEFNIGDVVKVWENGSTVFEASIISNVQYEGSYFCSLSINPSIEYIQGVNGYTITIQRSNSNENIPVIDIENSNSHKPSIASDNQKATINANVIPKFNPKYNLGSSSNAWKDIYSHDGGVHASDARLKTEVAPFSQDEINAAKQLSKEIGIYKWLSSVEEKGDAARKHIGMTVQRAIEIMTANNLNPFDYGFICYDEWEDEFKTVIDVEAIEYRAEWSEEIEIEEAKEAWTETIINEDGIETIIEHEAIPAKKDVFVHPEIQAVEEVSHQEKIKSAGNMYSFRYTELLAFIAAGFEARLTALENL